MNQGKRLLFYIALNILVSACTTLAILWLWDRPHQILSSLFPQAQLSALVTNPAAAPANPPTPASTSAAVASPVPASQANQTTPPPAAPSPGESDRLITIDNVFGVGNLKDEYVLLKRAGEGELSLTGWHLDDGNGSTYTFPALTLYKDGAVQIHTAAGVDSVVDLYWGRSESVWQVGKIVTLTDDKGSIRATYRIP